MIVFVVTQHNITFCYLPVKGNYFNNYTHNNASQSQLLFNKKKKILKFQQKKIIFLIVNVKANKL